MLPPFQPMPLQKRRSAFNNPDWIFELKYDGFRALAYIEAGEFRLLSRNSNQFKSFPALNPALVLECKAKSAVLDGEIVFFDKHGCSQFEALLFRRGEPRFVAFDCLYRDGENLHYLPLSGRKHRLRGVVPENRESLLYCHVEGIGEALFRSACERDLEGVVAKRKSDPYLLDGSASWVKVRNPNYSQWVGREELFERERSTDPDHGRDACTLMCERAASGTSTSLSRLKG